MVVTCCDSAAHDLLSPHSRRFEWVDFRDFGNASDDIVCICETGAACLLISW